MGLVDLVCTHSLLTKLPSDGTPQFQPRCVPSPMSPRLNDHTHAGVHRSPAHVRPLSRDGHQTRIQTCPVPMLIQCMLMCMCTYENSSNAVTSPSPFPIPHHPSKKPLARTYARSYTRTHTNHRPTAATGIDRRRVDTHTKPIRRPGHTLHTHIPWICVSLQTANDVRKNSYVLHVFRV